MKTIQSSVAFTDSQNNVLANGFIIFQLSGPAKVISGGGLILQNIQAVVTLTAGGLVPSNTQIFANDELQPTGTYYTVRFFNSKNSLVRGPEIWVLSGVSPIDLSQVTNVSVPDPGLGNPVLQNPSAAQTITGQSLTLSNTAPLVVNGGATLSALKLAANATIQDSSGLYSMGATLKKGTGNGTDYTTTSASYVDVDATNLSFTTTIPNGWKLMVTSVASIFTATNTAFVTLGLYDSVPAAIVAEQESTTTATGSNGLLSMVINWVITGDGASHTIKLQAKTSAGTLHVFNSSATLLPTMTFLLLPSN